MIGIITPTTDSQPRWIFMGSSDNKDKSIKPEDWQPVATFVVEFSHKQKKEEGRLPQFDYLTSVHCLENDASAQWEGVEGKELTRWMLQRAVAEATSRYQQGNKEKSKTVVNIPIKVTLESMALSDTRGGRAVCSSDGFFNGYVLSGDAIEALIKLNVSGTRKESPVSYCRIDLSARSISDGKRLFLGFSTVENLRPGNISINIKDISLARGVYSLRVTTLLDNCRPRVDYMEAVLLVVL